MTTLEETLPILDREVPAVVPKLAAVAEDAASFEAAVRDLLENVSEKEEQARELLSRVRASLTALEDGTGEMHDQLRQALDAAETAVEAALSALNDGQGDLRSALQTAGEAMEDLKTQVQEAGTRTEAAREDAGQTIAQLGQDLQTQKDELGGAVDEVEGAAEAVATALEQGRTSVSEAADELGEKMSSLLDDLSGRLGEAQSRLRGLQSGHETGMQDVMTDMTNRKDDILRSLQERVQDELRQAMDETLGEATSALSALGEAALLAEEMCREAREELDQQLAELGERIPVMTDAVEQVKQAANLAGITWQ
jgi:chromosome segregation ATPase